MSGFSFDQINRRIASMFAAKRNTNPAPITNIFTRPSISPFDSASTCRAAEGLYRDYSNRANEQQAILLKCDPNTASRNRAAKIQEINNYLVDIKLRKTTLYNSLNNGVEVLKGIINNPATKYLDKALKKEESINTRKLNELNQSERRYRRSFLDGDPQDGVAGLPGVRTSDDKVLLAFWLVYGITIIVSSYTILQLLGVQGMNNYIKYISAAFFILYAIAYYCITMFA